MLRCLVANPLKEALTALADALAKRPVEELLFDWFRSGRLVGELSVLIKRRHPEVQAEIDRVCQEHLAKLVKGLTRPRKTIDYFSVSPQRLAKPTSRLHVQSAGLPPMLLSTRLAPPAGLGRQVGKPTYRDCLLPSSVLHHREVDFLWPDATA